MLRSKLHFNHFDLTACFARRWDYPDLYARSGAQMGGNMDFLEAAAVLIPSLTGMAMAIYGGKPDVLASFEERFCFMPSVQRIYTAAGLRLFLEDALEEWIYDIIEPMGSRLFLFGLEGRWILLGPYVEEGWKEGAARRILAGLGASESVVLAYKTYRCQLPISRQDYVQKIALLLTGQGREAGNGRKIKTIHMEAGYQKDAPAFLGIYEDIHIINRRYHLEDLFMDAVSRGDTQEAYRLLKETGSLEVGLRFLSDSMKDQAAGAAIGRTMVRMGAKKAGLSPVLIDSISQEYAQRMQHASSGDELKRLSKQLVGRICEEVRKEQKREYSPYVKKALSYMDANLGNPMSVVDVSKAAGLSRSHFVKLFGRETGMTMKRYLAAKRCEIAANLLLDSALSVQEIGAYVGYPDNNYFSKVFRAQKGVSPQDYRKAH